MSRNTKNKARRHSSKAKSNVLTYGYKYRALDVLLEDFASAASLKAAIKRMPWIDNAMLYRELQNKKRVKNKKQLYITLETCCDDRLKDLNQKNLEPFIDAISGASISEMAAWLGERMKANKITKDRLKFWRKEIGYSFGGILELIHEQQHSLPTELGCKIAEWNALNRVHRKILNGEWQWKDDDEEEDDENDGNDNENVDVRAKKKKKHIDGEEDDEEDDDLKVKDKPFETPSSLVRRDNESTSSLFQRRRTLAKHPFLRPKGFHGSFLCSEFLCKQNDKANRWNDPKIKIITSSRGDQYICDEAGWFENDKKLMCAALLYEHRCVKYHHYMISQGALIQNVFRNKIIGDKAYSVNPQWQYLTAMLLAEHCNLVYRFKSEGAAFEKNKKLILESEDWEKTYQIGEWEMRNEGKTRLPRSDKQMSTDTKKNKNTTEFYVRLNPLKMAEFYLCEGDDVDQGRAKAWAELQLKWHKFGVFDIMHQYLTQFWPGNEQKAVKLGLLKEVESVFTNSNKNMKENENMLSFV